MTVKEFPHQLARVGSVLALIGSLVWIQWPIEFEKFGPGSFVAFVACLVIYIAIEFAEFSRNSSVQENILNDDVKKFNYILEIVDYNQSYVIMNYDIETYIDDEDYRGLRKIVRYFDDDMFPFHNKRVQDYFASFCQKSEDFLSALYEIYTSTGRGTATWRPGGDGYVSNEEYEKVIEEIGEIRRIKRQASDIWEEFIKVAREELKGSTVRMKQYEI
ncbi:hypothetical protein [Roseibium polysiphoniae]|uniref:hypothetical protein n=1 Tax=Roseibium polysiphoniae TaxID=2571221 RepID=UPI003298FCF8